MRKHLRKMEKAVLITQTNVTLTTNNKNYTITKSRCASFTAFYGGRKNCHVDM
jgi:hypothetical protein